MAVSPELAIKHILEAIRNIEEDKAGQTLDTFLTDRRTRQLVERNLEIISEASRRLPGSAKSLHPEIPWAKIAGIGNYLRHDYQNVNPAILWNTCRKYMGPLRTSVSRMLSDIENGST